MCLRHFIIQNLRVQFHLHSAMTPTSHSWEAWPGLCCSGAWDIIIPHQPTIHTHSSRPFNVLRAAMKQPMSKVLICPERACAHTSLFHCLNEASWASRVTGSLELGSGRAELVDLILCEDSGNCERRLRGSWQTPCPEGSVFAWMRSTSNPPTGACRLRNNTDKSTLKTYLLRNLHHPRVCFWRSLEGLIWPISMNTMTHLKNSPWHKPHTREAQPTPQV